MSSPNAPPLPPRGITPDKRSSNPYFYVDLSLNESSKSKGATLTISNSVEETVSESERVEIINQSEKNVAEHYTNSGPPPIPPKKDQ